MRNFLSSKGFLKNSEDSYSAFSCEGSSEFLSKSLQHLLSSLKTCTEVFTTLSCLGAWDFPQAQLTSSGFPSQRELQSLQRVHGSLSSFMDTSEELSSFPEDLKRMMKESGSSRIFESFSSAFMKNSRI